MIWGGVIGDAETHCPARGHLFWAASEKQRSLTFAPSKSAWSATAHAVRRCRRSRRVASILVHGGRDLRSATRLRQAVLSDDQNYRTTLGPVGIERVL
jgi:hypothetical protein